MQFYKSRSKSINRFLYFLLMWLYIFWTKYDLDVAFQSGEHVVTSGEALVFAICFAWIISVIYLLGIIVKLVTMPGQRNYYLCLICLTLIPVGITLSMFNISW
jgi:hypothetical protein